MLTDIRLDVLRGFRPLAHSLTIYNTKHFNYNENGLLALILNILRALVYTALVSTLAILACFNCRWVFLPRIEWSERAFHLAMLLVLIQQLFIFVTMTQKNHQISDTLEQLQRTVNSRKNFNSLC